MSKHRNSINSKPLPRRLSQLARIFETYFHVYRKLQERKEKDPSKEPDMSDVMDVIRLKGRDNARTPMLWDRSENGGFTQPGTKPWLRQNDEYDDINVDAQEQDPDSVLSYFKQLAHTRKQHPLMVLPFPAPESTGC